MRTSFARAVGFSIVFAAGGAYAQASDANRVDSATSIVAPSDPRLDLGPTLPSGATMWTDLGSLGPGTGSILTNVGSIAGGNRVLSLSFLWANDFVTARLSPAGSRISLRPPSVLGFQPFFALGSGYSPRGASGFGDLGAKYENGPLRAGWQLSLAPRIDGSTFRSFVTSTTYARYETRTWDLGIDHVAQLVLLGAVLQRDYNTVTISGGVHPSPAIPAVRASTSIPLRTAALPFSRVSMVGVF